MNPLAIFSKTSLLALLLASACSGTGLPAGPEQTSTPAAPGQTNPVTTNPVTANPAPVDPTAPIPTEPTPVAPLEQVCATDGAFDFHVFGDTFPEHDGKTVVAAALENGSLVGGASGMRRPVRLATQVAGGAFSIACPSSLRETYAYPSYALFVDVDGDGNCGAGDLGLQMQLYGWNRALDEKLGPNGQVEWATFVPVEDLQVAIGGGVSFCEDYFPAVVF